MLLLKDHVDHDRFWLFEEVRYQVVGQTGLRLAVERGQRGDGGKFELLQGRRESLRFALLSRLSRPPALQIAWAGPTNPRLP